MASINSAPENPTTRMRLLTDGLRRENLPFLARLLKHLEITHGFGTAPEQFEERFVVFMAVYCDILHWAAHNATGDSLDVLRRALDGCKDRYANFIHDEKRVGSCYTIPMIPTFDQIFQEIVDSFEHLSGVGAEAACRYFSVNGKQMMGYQAFALEYAQHVDAKYTKLAYQILQKQPVYTDLPSDYDVYVSNRNSGQDPFFGLSNALRPFLHRRNDLRSVFGFFGELLALTTDLFIATSGTPSSAQANILLDACVSEWADKIGDVFAAHHNGSLAVRTHMAGINVRGVVDVLVQCCREILLQHPVNHLGWYLHAWVVKCAVSNHVYGPGDLNWVKSIICTDFDPDLLRMIGPPRHLYVPVQFKYTRLSRVQLNFADRGMNFDDIRFEPYGPPLEPRDYTDPPPFGYDRQAICVICQCELGGDTAVRLRACGHIMHTECVRDMINGLHKTANLCPLDRKQICPPRLRQPIINPPNQAPGS